MIVLRRALLIIVAATAAPGSAAAATADSAAHENGPRVQLNAQIRPRFEKVVGGGNFVARSAARRNVATTQRSRVSVGASSGGVAAHVSVQDVRAWGSETSTLGDFSADGQDVHEAWAQLGSENYLRIGRQEINLDGQRLIGAVNWTQQGRSFDAVRLGHRSAQHSLDVIATRLQDGGLHDMLVGHATLMLGNNVHLAVPLIYETNAWVDPRDRTTASGRFSSDESWRATGGLHLEGKNDLHWRVEGYLQAGDDLLAYMVGARVGYAWSSVVAPTLWVDYLSGNRDDEKTGVFDTLYATNHKFYGAMDRFLSIPQHTEGGGLIDVALKNSTRLLGGTLSFALHQFVLAEKDASGRRGAIGMELDATYTRPLHDAVEMQVGAAAFIDQGDFAQGRNRTVHDWVFMQLDCRI